MGGVNITKGSPVTSILEDGQFLVFLIPPLRPLRYKSRLRIKFRE